MLPALPSSAAEDTLAPVSNKTIAVTVDAPYSRARNATNTAVLTPNDLPLVIRNSYVFWFTLQQFTAGAWAKWTFPNGWSRKLVVRDPEDATGALLAFAEGAAFNNPADWSEQAPADGKECARISLHTPELDAWLKARNGSGRKLRLVLELLAINPADPEADPVTAMEAEFVLQDSWNLATQPPSPCQPIYVTAADVVAALAQLLNVPAGWRITANAATGQVYLEELP